MGNRGASAAFGVVSQFAETKPMRTSFTPLLAFCFAALFVTCLAAFITMAPRHSLADARCQRLLALHARYAGVRLTPSQKKLKTKLVAWYDSHCSGHHHQTG